MKYWKCYSHFVSIGYRLVMWLVVPVLLIALQTVSVILGKMSLTILIAGLLIFAGIGMEIWNFGGSCAKSARPMEYLKCSVRGKEVLKKVIQCDGGLRLVMYAAVLGVCQLETYFLLPETAGTAIAARLLVDWLTCLGGAYLFTMLGCIVARYCSLWNWVLLTSYVGTILGAAVFLIGHLLSGRLSAAAFILAVLLAIVAEESAKWSLRHMIKKMEDSYHDR